MIGGKISVMSDTADDRPIETETDPEPDPAEVEPTDNSSGAPADLANLTTLGEIGRDR